MVDLSAARKTFTAGSVTFQLILRKSYQRESANQREEEISGRIYRDLETPQQRQDHAR